MVRFSGIFGPFGRFWDDFPDFGTFPMLLGTPEELSGTFGLVWDGYLGTCDGYRGTLEAYPWDIRIMACLGR